MASPDEPIPAATVVLLRDQPGGLEVLLLRRNSALAFGGMWVFPGGRVDAGDAAPGNSGDAVPAARRAAAREAQEEAGLEVDSHTMVPFSHWVPPPTAPKRFSTWFFLAQAPETRVLIDGGEIHDEGWFRPADALARRDAGEIELAPPTWVTLFRLTASADVAGALAAAQARPPEHFATHLAKADGIVVALWDGDGGYVDGDASRPGARHRLWLDPAGWRYEVAP
ncbi:MAG TPA: NUDIX domain-containing protein [Acidimicrobiales bacterium]|nr:NUDIX domain-containing protein [Acidimicrobiales bacterium]